MKNINYLLLLVIFIGCKRQSIHQVSNSSEIKAGKYYIDINQGTHSTTKHFNTEIQVKGDSFKLIYVSREEFGYSDRWKKGDVWATGNLEGNSEGEYSIARWEDRGNKKVLVQGYIFKPIENGFKIWDSNSKRKTVGYYTSIPNNFRISVDSLHKAEMYESAELYAKQVHKIIENLGVKSVDPLTKHGELFKRINELAYPLGEIPTRRELLSRMGFSMGYQLVQNENWSWHYIRRHRNDYVGWIVASPNKEIGLAVEQYFFQADFYKKNIEFKEFVNRTKEKYDKKVDELTLFEPWMNYIAY